MEGGENRTPFLEYFHVLHVVVRRPIFPASEEVASPLALGDREAGKLVERLPVKFGAGVPKINHSGFAAAFGHRSDPGKTLDVARSLITGTIRAKEAQQPRGQRGASTGEFAEQMGLGMSMEDLFDAALVIHDDRVEGLDYLRIHLAQAAAAFDDG